VQTVSRVDDWAFAGAVTSDVTALDTGPAWQRQRQARPSVGHAIVQVQLSHRGYDYLNALLNGNPGASVVCTRAVPAQDGYVRHTGASHCYAIFAVLRPNKFNAYMTSSLRMQPQGKCGRCTGGNAATMAMFNIL
jgi:hypothetical protein